MMNLPRSFVFAIAVLIVSLFFSCTGIPIPEPRNEKQAVLVIAHEYEDEAPGTFYSDYLLYAYRTDIGSNLPFTIEVKTGSRFTVYRMLPPTTNTFRKIIEFDKGTEEKTNAYLLHDRDFELEAGKVNVYPYLFLIRLVRSTVPGEGRKSVQKISFEPLSGSQYRQITDELIEKGINPDLIVKAKVPEKE